MKRFMPIARYYIKVSDFVNLGGGARRGILGRLRRFKYNPIGKWANRSLRRSRLSWGRQGHGVLVVCVGEEEYEI
jgi:hypothetical protein